MPILAADTVSFTYDLGTPALRGVSLSIEAGEFISLAGPNGSGKTTLLRLLNRILIPNEGGIFFAGKPISGYSRREIATRMAFVPQESGIIFPFTVLEVVLMGRAPHARGRAFENSRDIDIAHSMMQLTDIESFANKPVTALSGGERQRAIIARALAQQPEVILLDEPNAHLDIAHQLDVFALLRKLNREQGLTIVSVSHDLNLAAAYSDRIALLADGSLASAGSPAEVFTESMIASVFGAAVSVDKHPMVDAPRITLQPYT